MGQKVNPLGFRVGITEDYKSKWYAPKNAYGDFLGEDFKLRKYIDEKLNRRPPFAAVSEVIIERTREEVTITLKTARPGLVIGPKGAQGSGPLTTLQADVNDGYAIAFTTYGTIGVKVWIYRGLYNDEKQVFETDVRPGGMMRRGRR